MRAAARLFPALALAAAWATGLATGCAAGPMAVPDGLRGPYERAPQVQRLLDPRPARHGPSWLGGDVATSIRVAEDEWIWLFGDTLFGTVSDDCPHGRGYCDVRVQRDLEGGLVNNSIGRMQHRRGHFLPIERSWRLSPEGEPRAVFASERPGHYLWPLAGAAVDGALLVLANENTPASGLAPVANLLLRVANPLDPVAYWQVDQQRIEGFRSGASSQGTALSWTTALIPDGEWLYFVGSRGEAGTAETVLARMPRAAAHRVPTAPPLEFRQFDEQGAVRWSPSLQPDALAPLPGLPGTTEASFLRTQNGWATWQIPPLRYELRLLTAPALHGPWSDRGVVYRIPPPWSTPVQQRCSARGRRRGARTLRPPTLRRPATPARLCRVSRYLAYAPKVHPQLGHAGETVLTWNVNVFFGTLAEAEDAAERVPGFYVPRALRSSPPPASHPLP